MLFSSYKRKAKEKKNKNVERKSLKFMISCFILDYIMFCCCLLFSDIPTTQHNTT